MTLLLALLLAAPERVVMVAKPAAQADFIDRVGRAVSRAARRLYERTDPDVDAGNWLAAEGNPEGALRQYDKAQERLGDSPALFLDRSGALLKLEAKEAPRAASEATQALQHGEGAVRSQAAYHLALATEAMGRPDDAIKAYGAALALDPADVDSKVNLELLLKSQEERKKQVQNPPPQESQQKQQKEQEQKDKAKGKEQQKEQKEQAGQKEEKKDQPEPQQGTQQEQKAEKKEQAAQEQKPVDRSEAERLLDALRAGEKNLQVWRFAKDKRKEARRGDVEKDW